MGKLDSKKASILDIATRIFSEKGFNESTISEIAKSVGIGDSAIYDYFASKEEILLAIPEEQMIMFLSDLKNGLEGIKGAENKLRKLIWHHCKFFTTYREYTHILLLDCRSNPRFYDSEGYELMKDYSKIIIEIIEEGKKEGKICSLSQPRLLRDMIMGAIDHAALNWIINGMPNPLDYAEEIYEIVINSVRPEENCKLSSDPRGQKRKQIINGATSVFSKKGYYESTISEIAREAGVAEGTIYEYFKSKEDLLISIPEDKLGEFLDGIDGASSETKFRKMILDYLRFFNDRRDYTSILVLMLRPTRKFYTSKSYEVLARISDNFRNCIIEGQKKGIFLKNVNIDVFEDMIFGTIDHIIIPWIIFKRGYDLMKVGEEAAELFVKAIRA